MATYGITRQGFEIKPFTKILEEKALRARELFGADVDLRPTSALRKILDLASIEDQELWKGLERLYYGNFLSTANGDSLDLLGEDLGLGRRHLKATGKVTFTLTGGAPGRIYQLPLGTLVETADGVLFAGRAHLSLSTENPAAEVAVEALERGPGGNVAAAAIVALHADYAAHHLRLAGAEVSVTNADATTGGELLESDADYRATLLGRPRALWTRDAVRRAVLEVDGVRDCRLFDPLGGVDAARSRFGVFAYATRPFTPERLLGRPYPFEILVAVHPGVVWESGESLVGLHERVLTAVDAVRPIAIHPVVRRASHVRVGLRARLRSVPGHDAPALRTAVRGRLETRINSLGLGFDVRWAEIVADLMAVTGVVDVDDLHLRRHPPQWNRVRFGGHSRFRSESVELAVGESLRLETDEIAEAALGAEWTEIEVSDR